jgi:cell wall-associated NlpC family hydrolase
MKDFIMNQIESMIEYAKYFVGSPYTWGGSNPLSGWDCSGFIQEVLASIGLDPKGDQTSQALFNSFVRKPYLEKIQAGSLIFYGASSLDIKHVALCINDSQIIEAAGGGSRTKSIRDAMRDDAFVRIRPVKYRSDFFQSLFTFI